MYTGRDVRRERRETSRQVIPKGRTCLRQPDQLELGLEERKWPGGDFALAEDVTVDDLGDGGRAERAEEVVDELVLLSLVETSVISSGEVKRERQRRD